MASEVELLEVFRLGEAAGAGEVVRVVSDRLTGPWLAVSRFRDVAQLTSRALQIQTSPGTLVHAGRAHAAMGNLTAALKLYEQALTILRQVGDRAGEATLNNIGLVHDRRGDGATALDYYEQALPIRREVGDRAGEATTLNNIAMVLRADGQLASAVAELEQVVELDRAVQYPDLESDTAISLRFVRS